MAALAAQPVITGVSIPNVSMKINDVVTATISVQSDSATVYTLNASNIGGYALGSLSKHNSTTYTVTFTVIEGGIDYAAGGNIPTSVTLADGVLTNTWTTAISQTSDPIDANRPTVTSFARQTPVDSRTNADTLVFRATFDEDVQNVGTGDFSVGGGSTAMVTSVAVVNASTYDVTVSGGDLPDGNGPLGLNLSGDQDIEDLAGNALPAGEPATDETYYIDNVQPDVIVDQAATQADPTNDSPIVFTAVFDEPINDATFTNADVTTGGTATTGAVTVTEMAPNDGTTFSVSVVVNGDGTVTATIPAGGVEDLAGNTNKASASNDNTVLYDNTPPSVPANLSPASGAYTNDTTPTLSWDASTDTGGSGMRDTNTYRVIVTGPSNKDYYTANTTYTPTLAEGVFTWKVYSRDNAGNNSNYTADHTLTIDTTQPDVTIDQAGAQADPTNSSPVVFTVVFDEPINTGTFTNVDVTIGGTATTGAVTVSEIAPNDGTTFSVSVVATGDGTVTVTIPAGDIEDLAGNTNTASTSVDNTVTYDSTPPQVSGVTAAPTQIADATAGVDKFTVTTVFSETMNTGTTPTLTFAPDVRAGGTPTLSNGSGAWSQTTVLNDTFTMTYDVADRDIDIDSVTVDVSGAKDEAGNDQQNYTPEHEFEIDTLNPIVEAVTPSVALINDAVAAGGTFTIEVEFSETMDTGTQPAISFAPNVASTLSFDHGAWSMTDFANDTYTATYNVTDAGVEIDDVAVDVTGAKDAAGNDQQDYTPENEFNIDALNPTVTSVLVNDTLITDTDDGGTFTVTVDFSEVMTTDGSADPAITFTPLVGTTLAFASENWPDSDTYTATYDVSDGNVDHDSITIDVTGAKDANGNGQQDYTPEHEFEIDTLNPTITSITSTTPDGYYGLGSDINVTVSFSEPVTLTGGTLNVTLDTPGDVVGLAAFGPATSSFTTYTIGAGDNSCDLDAIGVVLNGGTLQDNVGNDAVVGLPATTIADGSDITVDTTDPTIGTISITAGDNRLDANCEKMVNYSVTITDNCCIDLDASPITVTPSASNATVSGLTMTLTPNTGKGTSVEVSGTFVVSVTGACSSVPSVQIDVADCTGNTATRTDAGPTLSDVISPTFSNFTVTPTDGLVDDDCEKIVNFSVDVHDNCCIDLDDPTAIVVIESATNASTSGLTWNANETGLQTDFTITGSFTVEDLTGCPAIPTVEVQVTDLCSNTGTASQDGGNIEDEIHPVINDLMFNTDDTYAIQQLVPYLVDECGLIVVYFSANVTDNCCIVPGNVNVTVTLPMLAGEGAAILEDIVFDRVQNGQGRVDVTGNAVIRCLESCPPGVCMSRVQVEITASDCCGNVAAPDATGTGEGLVSDDILPIPRDDPRQDMVMDESAAIDPLVEVRLDEFGTYRLILRESTPVRIDVMANDADNSSHNTAHPFEPCIQCGPCGGQTGCCGVMYIHEIVEHPSYGTAAIEDDSGNCAGGTVIRYAPNRGYLGPDYFTYRTRDAFGNVSSVIAKVYIEVISQTVMDDIYLTTCVDTAVSFDVKTTDLWVEPDNPDEIPFMFSIVMPPMHGVISGDLGAVTYTVHGATTKEIESATITLVYTPAAGFVGRDAITLRVSDPFGGSSTAVVDIAVIECAGQPGAPPLFALQQGEIFPLIVPLTFASVYETAWASVTLIGEADGTTYQDALSATWEESIGRYVLRLDTAALPPGLYQMTIPLGNDETVTLMIEVSEAV